MANSIARNLPFDCPIFEFDLEGFEEHKSSLAQAILALRASSSGMKRSNHGGWHSDNTLHESNDSSLSWLADQLAKMSRLCLAKEQGSLAQQAIMSSCWANVNEYGDWNAPHAHIPATLAGVCYVKVPEKSGDDHRASCRDGDIIFINPMACGAHYSQPPVKSYRPKEGKVFIFPGFLLHMVAPHFASEARISISFNVTLPSPHQLPSNFHTMS